MSRPSPMNTAGTSQCSTFSRVSVTFGWVPTTCPSAHQTATRMRNTTMVTTVSRGSMVRKIGV